MLEAHLILSIFELIIIAFFAFCIFVGREKAWNLYSRFIIAFSLTFINVLQMVIEIMREESCVISIMMIIVWGLDIFVYGSEIRKFRSKMK